MKKTIVSTVMFMALAGCAERVKIDQPKKAEFVSLKSDARFKVNGQMVAAPKGEKFQLLRLQDGRKVVLLNSWVSSEVILMGAAMPQNNGAILDDNYCTTSNLVNIGENSVVIESAIHNVDAGVCFDLL